MLAGLSSYAEGVKVSGAVRDDNSKGLGGVKVTDGYRIVLTDSRGRYSFTTHDDARFVYLSIPSGYAASTRNGAPYFYRSIDRERSTQKADFTLYSQKQSQEEHQFLLWADVQVYNEDEIELVKKAAQDARQELSRNGMPAFAVSCGDIIGDWKDDFSVKVHEACAESGVEFFALMGNHDYKANAPTNEASKVIFTDNYGPTYYSFDCGRMHYVVLDDVFFFSRHYIGYIEESQMNWLKEDLKSVEKGSTVVLFMHIPTYSKYAASKQWGKEEYNKIVTNRNALYAALEGYNVHICSAHEHYAQNYIINEHIFEHVHAPLSGLFWQSLYSCDGVPWGYYVYTVKGNEVVDWYYKPVGLSRDCQFTAYAVGEDPLKPHSIVANVWNYDPAWTVEWEENGVPQGAMTQYDGWDRTIVADVEARREKEFTWKYIGAGETSHLFYAMPSDPNADVRIIVTDRFGRKYVWSSSRGLSDDDGCGHASFSGLVAR